MDETIDNRVARLEFRMDAQDEKIEDIEDAQETFGESLTAIKDTLLQIKVKKDPPREPITGTLRGSFCGLVVDECCSAGSRAELQGRVALELLDPWGQRIRRQALVVGVRAVHGARPVSVAPVEVRGAAACQGGEG
jgi:hypothetical protein